MHPAENLVPPALKFAETPAVVRTPFRLVLDPAGTWPRSLLRLPALRVEPKGRPMALLADPDAIQTVLSGSEARFPKWEFYDRFLGRGIGMNTLSVARGEQWTRLRKAFAPLFRVDAVDAEVPAFRSAADQLMAQWRGQAGPVTVEVGDAMTLLTLSVIWRLLRGEARDSAVHDAVSHAAAEISAAQLRGDHRGTAAGLATLAARMARSGAGPQPSPHNPLRPLVDSSVGGPLTQAELVENARAMLGAGHDTTALTLTWGLWLTAQDRQAQARARAEVRAIAGDAPLDAGHLGRLVYCEAILNEAQRLYPTCAVTVRRAAQAERLAGLDWPPGTVMVCAFYALHRHRDLWHQPDAFRPQRFLPESGETVHPQAFRPFSAGRHGCPASRFGASEALTVFATLIRSWQFDAIDPTSVEPRVTIGLRPAGSMPVQVRPALKPDCDDQ